MTQSNAVTASIYRTDPAQVEALGAVAWSRLSFKNISAEAVRAHCERLAAGDGIIAPRIVVDVVALTNAQITAAFLAATDAKAKAAILDNIAQHYGITAAEAFDEVTGEGAEHLLDYVTGPERAAARVLMQRRGFVA